MWNPWCLLSHCKGNWLHLNLILGTPSNFALLGWHQCSSRLVTVLFGTLWSSIKQIEAPFVFDWENPIALDKMQGNRASSRREGNVSWVFSSCGRNLGNILELQRGCPFETLGCSLKSGTCLGMRDNSGMETRRGRNVQTLLEFKREFRSLFLFDTVILGFLTILKNCQASSKFEAVNSTWLYSCQGMLGPFLRWRGGLSLFLGSLQGTQTSFHLVIWTMSMHDSSAGKFGLLSNQGISGSISLEA